MEDESIARWAGRTKEIEGGRAVSGARVGGWELAAVIARPIRTRESIALKDASDGRVTAPRAVISTDPMALADGRPTVAMRWATLFERASDHETTVEEVRAALESIREAKSGNE